MSDNETTSTDAMNEPQATPVEKLCERYPELEHLDEQDDEERIESFRSVLSGLKRELNEE
ncbi:hypothetical protein [Bifidobacterium sp. ESL0790]|uniref:hypothetical protein n=1 Tax=Bifidobacterium sp. ESL0790 TaxID=2983233 RepID=UPI0023F96F30|nr:hypothetical protein [Bifidobacterium sp. ESL0790]WEV71794.1 hypothetical protein OZY47_04870 [Bifidobacterium sp. ESL0790]